VILLRLTLVGFLAVIVLGCSSRRDTGVLPNSLSGKVTYNGKPVGGGTVIFIGKDKQGKDINVNAILQPDGSYSISGIPTGDHLVAVETQSVKPQESAVIPGSKEGQSYDKAQEQYMKMMKQKGATKEAAAPVYVKIPQKYASPKSSGLTVSVKEGANTKDFELKD
jgi:hypothetical protein